MLDRLHISSDSPIPRYLQLKSQFEYLIVTGELPPGSRLPSIRGLSRALGIGSATLVRAYKELEAAGLAVPNGGIGYFVLGNETSHHGTHGSVRTQVRSLLRSALHDGLTLDQVVQIVTAEVAEARESLAQPQMVLLCKRRARLEESALRLAQSLADLGVNVVGVPLEEVATNLDAWLPRLKGAAYVVSLLFDIKQARELLQAADIEVIPVLATPAEDVRERLVHLPPDIRVGIVASAPEFLDGIITAVTAFNPSVIIAGTSATDDRQHLQDLLSRADCVVYGSLCREAVLDLLPRSVEGIELVYVPDETSIQRLRALIVEERSA